MSLFFFASKYSSKDFCNHRSISGNSTDDVQLFRNYTAAHSKSARMFKHPRTGGVVVSTFFGDDCTFGQGSMENGWAFLKNELNKIVPVSLSELDRVLQELTPRLTLRYTLSRLSSSILHGTLASALWTAPLTWDLPSLQFIPKADTISSAVERGLANSVEFQHVPM